MKVAEAVLARVPDDPDTMRFYARALIETGEAEKAAALLTPHVRRLPKTAVGFADAAGLLGLAQKEVFIASRRRRSSAGAKGAPKGDKCLPPSLQC